MSILEQINKDAQSFKLEAEAVKYELIKKSPQHKYYESATRDQLRALVEVYRADKGSMRSVDVMDQTRYTYLFTLMSPRCRCSVLRVDLQWMYEGIMMSAPYPVELAKPYINIQMVAPDKDFTSIVKCGHDNDLVEYAQWTTYQNILSSLRLAQLTDLKLIDSLLQML